MLSKRRFTYEQQLSENPLNYDAWFDYIKLEESTGNVDRIREVSSQRCWTCASASATELVLAHVACCCACVGASAFVLGLALAAAVVHALTLGFVAVLVPALASTAFPVQAQ